MVRERTVRLESGQKLEVLEGGMAEGLPVFTLHGTPGSRLQYPAFAADAAAKGIRLISYDRPGYGRSSPVPGRRVVDEAAYVAAIADDLGIDRFAVWGWSGGGAPALACAASLPKRVVAAASLAGVAPYPAEGLDWPAGMGELNVSDFHLALEDPTGFDLKCRKDREELLAAGPDQLAEMWASVFSQVDRAALAAEFKELMGFLILQVQEGLKSGHEGMRDDGLSQVRPYGFDPSSIRVPVQIWQGGQDLMVPFAHGKWLAARVPHADVHLEPDEGHITIGGRHIPDVHRWLASKF